MPEFLTIPEIIAAARRNLPKHIWDFSAGGAGSEATLRRNRTAMDRYTFLPRVLRDVGRCDTSTTFLGQRLALPIMLAPVGSIIRFHPDGALAAEQAARRMGTATFISTMASPGLKTIAEHAQSPLIFQLYVKGDKPWVEKVVREAEESGYCALCVTVDSPVYGRRERDLENRFFARERPDLENFEGVTPDHSYQANLTWADLEWLRSLTSMPIIIKGIMTPEDALLAIEHGASAVYVSNHGGRQLDHAPASMDVLESIICAVAGRAEVVVDSGFLRGTDTIKALALGAKAVLIGKLQCWGLAADGVDGLVRTLELLQTEIANTMSLIGATSIADLGPELLWDGATPLDPKRDADELYAG